MYDFERKMFIILYSINCLIFIACLPLLPEIFGNMCILLICCPVCDDIIFEINLSFLIKLVFLHNQKVTTRILIFQESKKLLTRNKKRFS